jgi:RNA polymerase sigma-70 factor (ECF subfamily)
MEENKLVQRSREGDEEAFGALVKKYKGKVFNMAFSFTRDREAADDLAQEIFIKAYYALGKFKFKSGFGTWLYRIAVNHIKDHLRKHKKERHLSFDDVHHESKLAEVEADRRNDAREKETRIRLLHQALKSLPQKYRIIITLRDVQGHSYEEIASILDISPGTVDSRLHRARKMLREKIAPFLSREGGYHEMH